MDSKFTRNEIIELLPLYVLGTLDAEEILAVDAFIQQDDELLAQVAELETTVSQLAYVAPAAAPPADSLSRLLDKIETQADAAGPAASATRPRVAPPAAQPAQSTQPSRPPWWEQLMGSFNRWTWATAGLAALFVFLSVYTIQLRQENMTLLQQVQLLQQEINQNTTLIADLYQADRIVSLPGTEEAPEATGIFYTQNDTGFFVIDGLEPLPADQTYQLWLVPPGGTAIDAVSVGFLPVSGSAASAMQAVDIPNDLLDFYIVDVSVEPAGGSQNLSGPVVIRGTTE